MLLFVGCVGVVLFFRESAKMEAAYGLAIITTMFMTTILFANYLVLHRIKPLWIYIFLTAYVIIESAFLIALMDKFIHGGYITLMIGFVLFSVMYIWYSSRKIKTVTWSLYAWKNMFPSWKNSATIHRYPNTPHTWCI
jgi:KUP system potassium uptake protein